MRENGWPGKRAIALIRIGSVGNPIVGSKVYSLANVWSHTKASMEGAWEGHDEFSLMLKQLVNGDVCLL